MSMQYEIIRHPRYKYRLVNGEVITLYHFEPYESGSIPDNWVRIDHGRMYLRKGYAWNGLDIAVDTPAALRASLVHDAGYNAIAAGAVSKRPWKKHFDKEFLRVAREDGTSLFRALYMYCAVRLFGGARGVYKP